MFAFPILSTPLLLREMHQGDRAQYAALLTDDTEACFITDSPVTANLVPSRIEHNRLAFEQFRAVYWSVTRKDSFVGFVALHAPVSRAPALSYAISRTSRRQGIATEAPLAVVDFVFSRLNAECLLASTHIENVASAELLLALQYRDEGLIESLHDVRRRFRLVRS